MKIHIFNPEHDIALSANTLFWTAPHAGRQLRSDLAWLPALWASDGDVVLVDDVESAVSALRKTGLGCSDINFIALRNSNAIRNISGKIEEVCPWGWDKPIVHILNKYGIPRNVMPSDEVLDFIRDVSDRRTSSILLADIRRDIGGLCGTSETITDISLIPEYMERWGSVVIKSPWSSSGRGIRYVCEESKAVSLWADKVVRTMGHIMVEPLLDKILDFGMEYDVMPDGTVRYCGLSLFKTVRGAYEGSILATEEEKEALLRRFIDISLLHDVQKYIASWMKVRLKGKYCGPFGVDMMLVAGKDDFEKHSVTLNPCVEINLRRTMGHVALAISPVTKEKGEVMRIAYEGTGYHFRKIVDHDILF